MPADRPALDGLRVLELGSFIAGPFAGQLLGDLGADVVKVEPPETGDPMRRWGVLDGGRSLWWPAIARNKRSVAVDLRDERGRDVVRRHRRARGRRAGELQAGHARALGARLRGAGRGEPGRRARARLRATARPGPARARARASARSVRPSAGSGSRPARRTGRPARTGISLGDSLAALFAVIGTLTALHERDRSGQGQEVDVAIAEAVFALMESTVADFELGGVVRTRNGGVLKGVAPSNAYPTVRRPRRRDRGERRRGLRPALRRDGATGARDRPALRRARGARRAPGRARRRDRRAGARSTRPTICSRGPRAALGAVRAHPRRARSRRPIRSSRRATWCCGSRPASTARCRWPASSRSSRARRARCARSAPRSASTPTSSCATSPASPTTSSSPPRRRRHRLTQRPFWRHLGAVYGT